MFRLSLAGLVRLLQPVSARHRRARDQGLGRAVAVTSALLEPRLLLSASPIVSGVFDGDRKLNEGDRLTSTVSTITVSFSDEMSTDGGVIGENSITNPQNWRLHKNGADATGLIAEVTFGYNATSARYEAEIVIEGQLQTGTYSITALPQIQDASGNNLDGDNDGASGGAFILTFGITDVSETGPVFHANTHVTNNQATSASSPGGAVAMDQHGNFVVTWESRGQDGTSGLSVYAQRFDANGTALGSEFRVNSTTAGDQKYPAVAMRSNGDFIITWTSDNQDGDLTGVYAQRYNSHGAALGSEFQVNVATSGDQRSSRVDIDGNGNFIITWWGRDGSGFGVYARRYGADGVELGTEFRVNTVTANNQYQSSVSINPDGRFVIVWSSYNSPGEPNTDGIYARIYDSNGVPLGSEFRVHANPDENQSTPNVDMDEEGNFVVVWHSTVPDLDGLDVFARCFDANGDPRAEEFMVNSFRSGWQNNATVRLDSDGDFVVGWESDPQGAIIMQRYSRSGTPIGDQVTVLARTSSTGAQDASIGMNDAGDFVTVWTAERVPGFTDSLQGVYGRRYQLQNLPSVLTASPAQVSYSENSAPVPINPSIVVQDLDDVSLVEATVRLLNVDSSADRLAFVNDGMTMGNIVASSSTAGVLVLTSDGFTATVSEWQAALRAVTYCNVSDNPAETPRHITYTVNDSTEDSNTLVSVISVTVLDDLPVLSGIESDPLPFAPDSLAAQVTSTLVVTDPDSLINGGSVWITGFQSGDRLVFADSATISGEFNSTSGVLTLSGNASAGDYQAALRSIKYFSTSQNADLRTVSFQVFAEDSPSDIVSRSIGGVVQQIDSVLKVFGSFEDNSISITHSTGLEILVDGQMFSFSSDGIDAIEVYGRAGNDMIRVMSMPSSIHLSVLGGWGADDIRVDAGVLQSVYLDGGSESDVLMGGGGDDVLVGGFGNDWLNGGEGGDRLEGGDGNDVYAFRDAIANQIDIVVEDTLSGIDTLSFSECTASVTVNLQSEILIAHMARRIVKVGQFVQADQIESVLGSTAGDFITGHHLNNVLKGNGGNDVLDGGDGNDHLDGGEGNDIVRGGTGDDLLRGGSGNDVVNGLEGNDVLEAGEGNDTMSGGVGNDQYKFLDAASNQMDLINEIADQGVDSVDFSFVTGSVSVDLSGASQWLASMNGRLVATEAYSVENAVGGFGPDRILGSSGNNVLIGGPGNDNLIGGGGNDILLGGEGDDTLKGTSGQNILVGDGGSDLLIGGSGDDLILSAATLLSENSLALRSLMLEWSSDNPYQERVNHLLGVVQGGLNGRFVLSSSTVRDDEFADHLSGGGGADWFLADAVTDMTLGREMDEVFTSIEAWD